VNWVIGAVVITLGGVLVWLAVHNTYSQAWDSVFGAGSIGTSTSSAQLASANTGAVPQTQTAIFAAATYPPLGQFSPVNV
jgi:hypothetical protein